MNVGRRRKVIRKPNIILKKKRVIKCGSCGETGHNKKTCGVLKKKIRGNWSFIKSIDKIPSQAEEIAKLEKEVPEPDPCSICFEDCCGKTCILECEHEFHTTCIFTWFKKNNNCPICRAEVPQMKKVVERRGVNLPSVSLMNAVMRMVDDTLSEHQIDGDRVMSRQRYVQAVMSMLSITLENVSPEGIVELEELGGFA